MSEVDTRDTGPIKSLVTEVQYMDQKCLNSNSAPDEGAGNRCITSLVI